MKTIQNLIQSENGNMCNQIVEHNDKVFRLVYVNSNGTQKSYVDIRTPDGNFIFVTGNHYLGFTCQVSYVAAALEKHKEANRHFRKYLEWIRLVY